jgi:hypothetical protein
VNAGNLIRSVSNSRSDRPEGTQQGVDQQGVDVGDVSAAMEDWSYRFTLLLQRPGLPLVSGSTVGGWGWRTAGGVLLHATSLLTCSLAWFQAWLSLQHQFLLRCRLRHVISPALVLCCPRPPHNSPPHTHTCTPAALVIYCVVFTCTLSHAFLELLPVL